PERRDAGRGAVRSGRRLAVPLRRRRDPAPGHGTDPAHESAQDPRVPGLGDSGGLHGRGQRGGRRRARAHGGQPSRLPAPARAGAVHGAAAGGALPRARREERVAQPPRGGGGRTPARGARVMASAAEIQAVLASGLFDLDWYRQRWPAAAADPEAAVAHFLDRGVSLGLDPGPAFSARRYLRENPDVAAAGMNPLLHYLAYGRGEGRVAFRVDDAGDDDPLPMPQPPSPQTLERWAREVALLRDSALFDPDFYLDRYPDVRAAGVDPLQHFVEHGAREGRWPNPWFDPAWYRANHQRGDDAANPLLHYAHAPDRATSRTSEWFDGGYYRKRHPDAAAGDLTPLEHFLRHGVDRGHATREESRAALPARIPDLRGVAATVVVTVYNAASHLEACLDSVLRHTRLDAGDRLLAVADASDEPAVAGGHRGQPPRGMPGQRPGPHPAGCRRPPAGGGRRQRRARGRRGAGAARRHGRRARGPQRAQPRLYRQRQPGLPAGGRHGRGAAEQRYRRRPALAAEPQDRRLPAEPDRNRDGGVRQRRRILGPARRRQCAPGRRVHRGGCARGRRCRGRSLRGAHRQRLLPVPAAGHARRGRRLRRRGLPRRLRRGERPVHAGARGRLAPPGGAARVRAPRALGIVRGT